MDEVWREQEIIDGEPLEFYGMTKVTVDGIRSSKRNVNDERTVVTNPIIMMKYDNDAWDSPYTPILQPWEEVDEEEWLHKGVIRAKR